MAVGPGGFDPLDSGWQRKRRRTPTVTYSGFLAHAT
jgi:hypothetical protein